MTQQRTIETIDTEIAETEAALADVHGSQTEVYARIVGYYRSVRNWNKGKRDEFTHRLNFTYDDSIDAASPAAVTPLTGELRYELYQRVTCPNCPPVKNWLSTSGLTGDSIDVDTPEGSSKALAHNVRAAPTVIFYDVAGKEAGRAYNTAELNRIMGGVAAGGRANDAMALAA